MKLTVTIIAFNEEQQIAKAVKSAQFADEILVVDSHSQDQTCSIAKKLGAEVLQNEWPGFGQQKNWAAQQATHSWIFSLDADEVISPELQEAILLTLQRKDHQYFAYQIKRLNHYLQKPLYHGGHYPDLIPRLYHREHYQFNEPPVHERLNTPPSIETLKGQLLHYSFPTIKAHYQTNWKYAELHAQNIDKKFSPLNIFFRALWKFINSYIIKRGFLDGPEGFMMSFQSMMGVFLKYALAYEKNGHAKK
jgi:(heptosyl)LPS beta-1,4-glucosyltransferase